MNDRGSTSGMTLKVNFGLMFCDSEWLVRNGSRFWCLETDCIKGAIRHSGKAQFTKAQKLKINNRSEDEAILGMNLVMPIVVSFPLICRLQFVGRRKRKDSHEFSSEDIALYPLCQFRGRRRGICTPPHKFQESSGRDLGMKIIPFMIPRSLFREQNQILN
eukprot:Gregarina_sp_Poly_1__5283@NODE_279_length_10190_cov_93_504495_g243_i0_p10_GENE_NODE_279_length_10190_cov_93_504495_g243_i0NODE_279_length_10190_cov_93_504495_g243_i0_p10_ORF_typecomplete_len161_score6_04_NODE_279_length_10190_cov_93_504495_g243_i082208702